MTTYDNYKQVIPADFYNVVHEMTAPGIPDPMICSYGFGGAGYTITQGDTDLLEANWNTTVMQALSSTITHVRTTVYDSGGSVFEQSTNTPGVDAGSIGPLSNAVLVEKRTGVSGRRNRGRFYLPGVEEAHVGGDGIIASGQVSAYQTVMDDFLTGVQAVDALAEMVLLHSKGWDDPYFPIPADPGNAPAPTVVTSLVVGTKIGTQRRRIR